MSLASLNAAKRVFSGIQPTGVPHLGNYLGTIKNWVSLQNESPDTKLYYSIVDLHALTVPRNPRQLREDTNSMAAALIACGIDPTRSSLFRQSAVAGHSQLYWVLSTITPVGWLNRMTQWKSKLHQQQTNQGNVNAGGPTSIEREQIGNLNVHSSAAQGLLTGLFTYPVLMAADVLLYKATHVPVGEDQTQHMELARDLVTHFNKTFKTKTFPVPKVLLTQTKRVMSLKDPTRKMSKSEANPMSRIDLTDSNDEIRKKIKKAPTDSVLGITFDPKERPGVSNLISIYMAMKDISDPNLVVECMGGFNNSQMKEMVAEAVVEGVAPIRERLVHLLNDPGYLEDVMRESEIRARHVSETNWKEISKCVGLCSS